jgi:hypothetical protein
MKDGHIYRLVISSPMHAAVQEYISVVDRSIIRPHQHVFNSSKIVRHARARGSPFHYYLKDLVYSLHVRENMCVYSGMRYTRTIHPSIDRI